MENGNGKGKGKGKRTENLEKQQILVLPKTVTKRSPVPFITTK